MTESKSKKTYISFDIESAGANFENPILQVGVAWGSDSDNIQTRSWCFDHPDGPFEKRCVDEFWVHHKDILERIQKEAKASGRTVDEQWKNFATFMDDLYKTHKLVLVSDNPAYDISMIDYELRSRKLKSSGLRFSPYPKPNTYLPVHDPTERIKGLDNDKANVIREAVNKIAKHTHWAADDALNILLLEFAVQYTIDHSSGSGAPTLV